MTQIDSDAGLNHLILGGAKDVLVAEIKKYQEFIDEFHRKVEQRVLDTLAVVFKAEPGIQTVQWTQSAGQYNDSTYDGFSISYLHVTYGAPVILKDWQGNDYETDADEPIEISDIPQGEVRSLLESLSDYIQATSDFWEVRYGSHIKVEVDRDEGFRTSYHDSY